MVSGSGTSNDPFVLSSFSDLELIGTSGYSLSAYYKLGADIDASPTADPAYNNGEGWLPIGLGAGEFTGDFDGNNKSISNLYINRPATDHVGLFSQGISNNARYPEIKDLSLLNCDITGQNYVGGINGSDGSNFTRITVTGKINGNSYVGGIMGAHNRKVVFGQVNFLIDGCTVNATMSCTNNYLGGILGGTQNTDNVHGSIQNCNINSILDGNGYVGGVCGYCVYTHTSTYLDGANCTVKGTITATGDCVGGVVGSGVRSIRNWTITDDLEIKASSTSNYVGGIVGYTDGNAAITDCNVTTAVSGKDYIGGIVGGTVRASITFTLDKCQVDTSISGQSYIGGIVGQHMSFYTPTYLDGASCTVKGTITATGDCVGGVVGSGVRSIRNWTITDDLEIKTSSTSNYVGGIVGYTDGDASITDCNVTTAVSGKDYIGGIVGGTVQTNVTFTLDKCQVDASISGQSYIGGIAGQHMLFRSSTYLDGASCTVKGTITATGDYVGGVAGAGVRNIRNWTITDDLEIKTSSTSNYVGGIVGYTDKDTAITDCNVTTAVSGKDYIGGIVGGTVQANVTFTLDKCQVDASISGQSYIGGIAGRHELYYSSSKVSNCTIKGDISGSGDYIGGVVGVGVQTFENLTVKGSEASILTSSTSDCVGGIGGHLTDPITLTNCKVIINLSGRDYIGGLVGKTKNVNNSNITTNCFYKGNILGRSYLGGLYGYSSLYHTNSLISSSYSIGKISGTGNYVGGFCGQNNSAVKDCFSRVDVSGLRYVGGFCGNQYDRFVTNCYSGGTVSGAQDVGGFIGSKRNAISTNCFWDIEASGQSTSVLGEGKTTAEMKTKSTYTNWDFATPIWGMQTLINDGYPYLSSNFYNIVSMLDSVTSSETFLIPTGVSEIFVTEDKKAQEYVLPENTLNLLDVPYSIESNYINMAISDINDAGAINEFLPLKGKTKVKENGCLIDYQTLGVLLKPIMDYTFGLDENKLKKLFSLFDTGDTAEYPKIRAMMNIIEGCNSDDSLLLGAFVSLIDVGLFKDIPKKERVEMLQGLLFAAKKDIIRKFANDKKFSIRGKHV